MNKQELALNQLSLELALRFDLPVVTASFNAELKSISLTMSGEKITLEPIHQMYYCYEGDQRKLYISTYGLAGRMNDEDIKTIQADSLQHISSIDDIQLKILSNLDSGRVKVERMVFDYGELIKTKQIEIVGIKQPYLDDPSKLKLVTPRTDLFYHNPVPPTVTPQLYRIGGITYAPVHDALQKVIGVVPHIQELDIEGLSRSFPYNQQIVNLITNLPIEVFHDVMYQTVFDLKIEMYHEIDSNYILTVVFLSKYINDHVEALYDMDNVPWSVDVDVCLKALVTTASDMARHVRTFGITNTPFKPIFNTLNRYAVCIINGWYKPTTPSWSQCIPSAYRLTLPDAASLFADAVVRFTGAVMTTVASDLVNELRNY